MKKGTRGCLFFVRPVQLETQAPSSGELCFWAVVLVLASS